MGTAIPIVKHVGIAGTNLCIRLSTACYSTHQPGSRDTGIWQAQQLKAVTVVSDHMTSNKHQSTCLATWKEGSVTWLVSRKARETASEIRNSSTLLWTSSNAKSLKRGSPPSLMISTTKSVNLWLTITKSRVPGTTTTSVSLPHSPGSRIRIITRRKRSRPVQTIGLRRWVSIYLSTS